MGHWPPLRIIVHILATIVYRTIVNRKEDGEGVIFAEQLKRNIKFHVPTDKLACVFKRDVVQHSFIEELYEWGDSLRHYKFGEKMGKDQVPILLTEDGLKVKMGPIDPKDTGKVVGIYHQGFKKYGKKFKR